MPSKNNLFGIQHPAHKACLVVGDAILLGLAFFLASNLRLDKSPNFFSLEYIGISSIAIACLFLGGSYTSSKLGQRPKLPLNTFFLALASSLPSIFFIYVLGPERYTALFGRGIYPIALIIFGFLAVLNHYFFNALFFQVRKDGAILLLGKNESKQLESLLKNRTPQLKVAHSNNLCADTHALSEISSIVISPDYRPNSTEQQLLLNYRLSGLAIYSLSDFFENYFHLVPVQEITNDWFIRSQGFTMLHSSVALRIKRAVDVISSLVLLIIATPIGLLSALIIKTVSRGPVFFTQERVGFQGSLFTLYKFRTMRIDAEASGAKWASKDDDRIIPFGRFLRASRIDELPQCINILKGEMSIVGPRPERPEFTAELAKEIPYYDLRHIVKPGLTGWAQVNYPYGASVEDALRKLQLDLYYIKNYSLILDLNILLRTVLVTLKRAGQ